MRLYILVCMIFDGSRVMKSSLNNDEQKETLKIIEQLNEACD